MWGSLAILVVVTLFNRAVVPTWQIGAVAAPQDVQMIMSEKKAARDTVAVRSTPDPFAFVEMVSE